MLCRLPALVIFTRPLAVKPNRFLALLFVFNLGIFSLFLACYIKGESGMPGAVAPCHSTPTELILRGNEG